MVSFLLLRFCLLSPLSSWSCSIWKSRSIVFDTLFFPSLFFPVSQTRNILLIPCLSPFFTSPSFCISHRHHLLEQLKKKEKEEKVFLQFQIQTKKKKYNRKFTHQLYVPFFSVFFSPPPAEGCCFQNAGGDFCVCSRFPSLPQLSRASLFYLRSGRKGRRSFFLESLSPSSSTSSSTLLSLSTHLDYCLAESTQPPTNSTSRPLSS